MNNYCAQINNNVVIQVIVADFEWVKNNLRGYWVDLGGDPLTVGIGYIYDPQTNEFTEPIIEPIEQ